MTIEGLRNQIPKEIVDALGWGENKTKYLYQTTGGYTLREVSIINVHVNKWLERQFSHTSRNLCFLANPEIFIGYELSPAILEKIRVGNEAATMTVVNACAFLEKVAKNTLEEFSVDMPRRVESKGNLLRIPVTSVVSNMILDMVIQLDNLYLLIKFLHDNDLISIKEKGARESIVRRKLQDSFRGILSSYSMGINCIFQKKDGIEIVENEIGESPGDNHMVHPLNLPGDDTDNGEHNAGLAAYWAKVMVGTDFDVTLEFIQCCAKYGDDMTSQLRSLHEGGNIWKYPLARVDMPGTMILILGLIPTKRAGNLLLEMLRKSKEIDKKYDIFNGCWGELFVNKPEHVLKNLMLLAQDRSIATVLRIEAVYAVLFKSSKLSQEVLDASLKWVHMLATGKQEDQRFVILCADGMLDYPRPQFQKFLKAVGIAQREAAAKETDILFDHQEVEGVYAGDLEVFDRPLYAKSPYTSYLTKL